MEVRSLPLQEAPRLTRTSSAPTARSQSYPKKPQLLLQSLVSGTEDGDWVWCCDSIGVYAEGWG